LRPGLAIVAAIAIAIPACPSACDRTVGAGTTRALVLHGLARCPRNVRFERPVVVRVDRDRSIFEDAYSAQVSIERPEPTDGKGHVTQPATLLVARQRMRVTLRIGLCVATSLGTWDCAAPSWLGSEQLTLDARDQPFDVELPRADVPCADGTTGKPPSP
jgi:hypothetical protein